MVFEVTFYIIITIIGINIIYAIVVTTFIELREEVCMHTNILLYIISHVTMYMRTYVRTYVYAYSGGR